MDGCSSRFLQLPTLSWGQGGLQVLPICRDPWHIVGTLLNLFGNKFLCPNWLALVSSIIKNGKQFSRSTRFVLSSEWGLRYWNPHKASCEVRSTNSYFYIYLYNVWIFQNSMDIQKRNVISIRKKQLQKEWEKRNSCNKNEKTVVCTTLTLSSARNLHAFFLASCFSALALFHLSIPTDIFSLDLFLLYTLALYLSLCHYTYFVAFDNTCRVLFS